MRREGRRAHSQRAVPIAALFLAALAGMAAWLLRAPSDRPAAPSLAPDSRTAPAESTARTEPEEPALDALRRSQPEPRRLRVSGRVTRRTGQPVEGARVDVLVGPRGGGYAEVQIAGRGTARIERREKARPTTRRIDVGTAITGADGRFELVGPPVDELALLGGPSLEVTVHAFAPGHRPGEVVLRAARDLSEERYRADLKLRRGAIVTGRIVSSDGEPVAGAQLKLVSLRGSSSKGSASTTSFDDGVFALAAFEDERTLVARAANVGSARRDAVAARDGEDRDLGAIALFGPGVLEGDARFPDGAPCDGLELFAIPAELATAPDPLAELAAHRNEREDGQGLQSARVVTDADGHFRASGLRSGPYELRPLDPNVPLARPGAVAWTGTRGLLLEVRARRIDFELVEARGAPVVGAQIEARPLPAGFVAERDEPPAPIQRASDVHGRTRLFVPSDARELGLAAWSSKRRGLDGGASAHERIALADAPFRIERRLELSTAVASGRVRATVRTLPGLPMPGYQVQLRSVASLASAASFSVPRGRVGRSIPLPPGPYVVVATPGRARLGATELVATRLERPLELRAGADTALVLEPRLGGHLSLALEAPPYASGSERGAEEATARARGVGRHAGSARLVGADGVETPFLREAPEARGAGKARIGRAGLLPGAGPARSGALEPGVYELVVEIPGFERATARVSIVSGATTEAALALVPESR